MKAAIYSRVSTDKQTTDNQIQELLAVAERNSWNIEAVYRDVISGAKEKRPELDALMKSVIKREVDVVLIWDISRLGRSLQHLLKLLEEFHAKGVDVYFHQQGIDTTTPAGKLMFQMCGAFAEFERGMIQERVKAGLQRAKAQGKRLGRPTVPTQTATKVKQLHEVGMSFRKIANEVGLHHKTVSRLCA
jgi:DNA invertase Pin-like site-specific DNA recombinase|tara:strand:- start:254 stop:820 length:567 start_codon:yes stop_codon:yes gene_type:complete